MAEQRDQDNNVNATDQVAAFRRAARLADANPLRLLPTAALSVLQALSMPFTALIEATPVARLSEVIAKQTATGKAARASITPSAGLPSGGGIGQLGAQPRAKSAFGPADAGFSKATPSRVAAADTTLAQRRAQARAATPRRANAASLGASEPRRSAQPSDGPDQAKRSAIGDLIKSSIEAVTHPTNSASRQGSTAESAIDVIGNISRTAVEVVTKSIETVGGSGAARSQETAKQSASQQEINRIIADFMARLGGIAESAAPVEQSTLERAIEAPGDLARIATDLVNKGLTTLSGPGAARRAPNAAGLGSGMAQLIADAMKRAGITSAPLATNPAPSPPTAPGEDLGAILSAIPQANRGPGSAIEPPTRADDLFEALYRDGVDLSWP